MWFLALVSLTVAQSSLIETEVTVASGEAENEDEKIEKLFHVLLFKIDS